MATKMKMTPTRNKIYLSVPGSIERLALADVKRETMTENQIIKAACKLSAKSFLELMDHNGVFTEILDQDNICNANEGYLNVIVEGMPAGQSLLFFNGDLASKKV